MSKTRLGLFGVCREFCGALGQATRHFRNFGRSFLISQINASGSTPRPAASKNTVVMLGCRLSRSKSESVVGCSPANSASFSCVSPFSFRMRRRTSEKAFVISKAAF